MAAVEQEVVKPINASRIEASPEGKSSGFWEQFTGKQMVFQTKGKAIVKGTFVEFRNTFLRIEQASVQGVKKRVNPNAVYLDRNFISHFHEVCPVEDVEEDKAL